MLGLGISLATLSLAAGLRGVIAALPSIQLSQTSVAENTANGATIGTLSVVNGTGTWTFTKTADPDVKFGLSGASLTKAATVDYETKTAHSVTIQAANGTSTITRTFSIGVVNALEVTLSALSMSPTAFSQDAVAGTVIGTVSGLAAGADWTVFPNDGRVAKSGNNLVVGLTQSTGDFSITLRHTHPDAVNSPLDAVVQLTVTPVVVDPPTEEANYFTATPSAPNVDENALSGAELASMTAYFRPIQTTATANENTLNGAEILILEA